MTHIRYPDKRVQLEQSDWDIPGDYPDMTEEDLRASGVLKRVRRALKLSGISDKEIEAYTKKATSRCYNHL